jgi:hypothetical protein
MRWPETHVRSQTFPLCSFEFYVDFPDGSLSAPLYLPRRLAPSLQSSLLALASPTNGLA